MMPKQGIVGFHRFPVPSWVIYAIWDLKKNEKLTSVTKKLSNQFPLKVQK